MFWYTVILALLGSAVAEPITEFGQRIVGGELTTIDRYPAQAALLVGNLFYQQTCGASILNSRSVLTASHCFWSTNVVNYRFRVGSSFANSGGTIHSASLIIRHPSYNPRNLDNDLAIVQTATAISFNNFVQPAPISGSNYNLADNQEVWATGWGRIENNGPLSEQLRHVQIWTINQDICRARYQEIRWEVTDNMLCSGVLDVGGRDQCGGDSGGPLFHNGVVVGVCSWGEECALPRYPGVNVRVSRYTSWIQANA